MLNPKFVKKIRERLRPIVEGGDGAARERALEDFATRYAEKIASSAFWSSGRSLLHDDWFLSGDGLPSFEVRAAVQRDYLVALDPSAESEIDRMGSILSTDLWIEAATTWLSHEARDRIAREIKAHYDEALEEEPGSGLGSVSVHLKALKRLGDPLAAEKNFRRTYLTAEEGQSLSRLLNPPSYLPKGNIFKIFVFVFLLSIPLASAPLQWYLILASLALAYIIYSRIVPQLLKNNKGRRAYIWQIVLMALYITMMCAWYLTADSMPDFSSPVRSLILTFGLLYFARGVYIYSFLTWKRLPNPQQD